MTSPLRGQPGPDRAASSVLVVAVVAVAAAAAGLANGFAYDDIPLIVRDDRLHSLGHLPGLLFDTYWPAVPLGPAGRLYRPLTSLLLSVQWAVGSGSPLPFHIVSTLLYLCAALLVLALARRLLPAGPAAVAATLFAAHPVHTEVVGNVVGQGELLAAIGVLVAAILTVDLTRCGATRGRLAGVVAGFAGSLLAKEHALVFLGLAPLLVAAAGGWRALRREATGRLLLMLLLVAMLYLTLRHAVLGSLEGDLPHPAWWGVPPLERVLTMLAALPLLAARLLWPAHLQADYAPLEVELVRGMGARLIGGLLVLLGFTVALVLLRRRRVARLGLGWLALALLPASNLLFPTGIVLAERTLFLPSIGLCLAAGAVVEAVQHVRAWGRRPAALGAGMLWALVLLGVVRSAARLPVWADNSVLFATTVRDAPRSYWAWRNYAGDLVLQGRGIEALAAYRRSLQLFRGDPTVYDDLAGVDRRRGRCDLAVLLMTQALSLDAGRDQTAARLIGCLVTLRDFDSARAVARTRMARGREEFATLLQMVDSAARVPAPDFNLTPAHP